MRKVFLTLILFLTPVAAEAQWVYIVPPWNFHVHPEYKGMDIRSIPFTKWEQMASFDTSARCERARVFAREIRMLSPNDREGLLALFASGAEAQAREETKFLLDREQTLRQQITERFPSLKELAAETEVRSLAWWSASRCVPAHLFQQVPGLPK